MGPLEDIHSGFERMRLEARLLEYMVSGTTLREAGAALMEQGEKRNDVYRAGTRVKDFLREMAEEME